MTEPHASTLASQRRSSAIRLLSDLRQTVSKISFALSSETDAARLSALSRLLMDAEKTLGNCRIEQSLAKASPKQISAIDAYLHAMQERAFDVIALMGGNQCLAEGTLVATPAGPVPIERIEVGDFVYSHEGKPIRVLNTFDNGKRECISYFVSKKSWIECTADHKVLSRQRNHNGVRVRPIGDCSPGYQIRRVEVGAPLGPVSEPHAYAVGALLGDGCCRQKYRALHVSAGSRHVPDALAATLGATARKLHANNYTYSVDTEVCHHYDEWCRGRYAHEKLADLDVIKTWDRQSLLAFVAGVVDTDGSVYIGTFDNLCISVGMQARPVIEAIQYAFLALWQMPLTIHQDRRDRYKNGSVNYVTCACSELCARALRELDPYLHHPSKKWKEEYADLSSYRFNCDWVGGKIKPLGVRHTYDIEVDSPEHLFLLANGLVVSNSGKSYIGAVMVASAIRDDLKPGSICWCVSPNAELSIKTQQRYLWELLPHERLDAIYNEKTGFGVHNPVFVYDRKTADNPNGRNIVVYFKTQAQYSNDPDSFESATVTGIVWVDESIEERTWNAIQPRVAIHNVPIVVTTIPRMDWMFEAFEEPPPESKVYFDKLLPNDNPTMTADGYRRLEASIQSEEERDMRLFGRFMSFGGIVYREFIKDYKPVGHLVHPFPIPEDWPKWRFMDIGMDHPTVCLWGAVAPNGNKYVYREYRSRHTPVVTDAERIIALSEGESYQGGVIVDRNAYSVTKANQKSVAQQYEEAGLKMTPAIRVGSGIKEWPLIQMVKRCLLNNQLFVFDHCEGLIGELRKWKFKRDQFGEPSGDSFEDKNNDALDALKYWVAIGPQYAPQQIEAESTIA